MTSTTTKLARKTTLLSGATDAPAMAETPDCVGLVPPDAEAIRIGREPLSIEALLAVARGERSVALDASPDHRAFLAASEATLAANLADERSIYGVTTGVGASVSNAVPPEHQSGLPLNLLRFHGCGTGRILDEEESAAVVAARLASLARGYSGVRVALLERLCELLNRRLLPRIPAEGSVGASGDLTPLSYLAATLVGEREVTLEGEVMDAAEAHRRVGLEPLALRPKESLAIMNGTSVMTALACVSFDRARRLAELASSVTAMASQAVHGNPGHFDDRIFALKPHRGTRRSGAWIRDHLESGARVEPARLQDRYSIRCAPHVIGVLLDAIDTSRENIEIEINGANDNPLVDPETGDILHGGNFYGGHICFAMDGLKSAVAGIADLLDRQLVLLCCPQTSDGLPENLIGLRGEERVAHHGFKAMQITCSALTAEALKLTMPAASFSRSTESHNQDKVSMGTIAARDCLRVLELTEHCAAIGMLAACQALDLRDQQANGDPGQRTRGRSRELLDAVRAVVPFLAEDRRQDRDIANLLSLYRGRPDFAAPGMPRGEEAAG